MLPTPWSIVNLIQRTTQNSLKNKMGHNSLNIAQIELKIVEMDSTVLVYTKKTKTKKNYDYHHHDHKSYAFPNQNVNVQSPKHRERPNNSR